MRRVLQYGHDKEGQFVIQVREDNPGFASYDQEVVLTRAECQKISKHMQFGKKGEERMLETVNGVEVK